MLRVVLVTEGDPGRMSGGFLYHQRLAARAAAHDATLRFVSVPERRFPLAVVDGRSVLRDATADADVTVVDSLASNTLGPWLARRGTGDVPLVGSVHQRLGGIDGGPVRRAVQRRTDALAWRHARRLVVASDLLADQLAAQGVDRAVMAVIPPGRDVTPPAAGTAVDAGNLRDGRSAAVLCVGNWLDRKGIVEVLDAFATLPVGAATLHLVGDEDVDGRYAAIVRQRLARADLAGRVVRHGVVAPAAMTGIYAAADVFVLASTEEPYGTVYGEAMAAGLPVVGWDAGNLPNLAADGVEGRVVPTGDVGALARALDALCTDDELRGHLGAQARNRAEKLPTWDDTADAFYALCRAVAG